MTDIQNLENDPWTASATLTGEKLTLVPLSMDHLDDLEKNLLSPNAWHVVHWGLATRADLEKVIQRCQVGRTEKTTHALAMTIKATGEAVGMSRFMNFNRLHQGIEIGGTWISEKWQKTFVNTEAKLLMLTYAFETIRCQRVAFFVDSMNFNSQRGVLRLGAKFEGELRHSCLLPDGRKRDYRVYSILETEWPNVKTSLNWYLKKHV